MARKLYEDAVERQSIVPDAAIIAYIRSLSGDAGPSGFQGPSLSIAEHQACSSTCLEGPRAQAQPRGKGQQRTVPPGVAVSPARHSLSTSPECIDAVCNLASTSKTLRMFMHCHGHLQTDHDLYCR